MADRDFRAKVSFIVETDGLLKDYIESIIIKKIKSEMRDDPLKKVSDSHVHAALILKSVSPCTLKTFAATMRMSKAAASGLVDRMVRAGIILREPNPRNRREVQLTVSPLFASHVVHVRAEITRWFESLADRLGIENFEKWYAVMVSLNGILQEEIQSGQSDI